MLIYTTNRHFGLVDTNRGGGEARGEYNRRQGQPVLSSHIRWTSFRGLRTALY